MLGDLLEALAATLAAADAFTGLAADDARRVAAQCAWDLVLYGQLGAASVAMTNRAEAAASCCFDWIDRDRVAVAFSRAAEAEALNPDLR